jgi:hypothetical protein
LMDFFVVRETASASLAKSLMRRSLYVGRAVG